MKYRLNKIQLFEILQGWSYHLKRKVHLIACGGTAMTLLGVKASTKDVDFMIPDHAEHTYLTNLLQKNLGYQKTTAFGLQRPGEEFQFDLFRGNNIHTTELLESPLMEGHNTAIREYTKLYVGVLNDYDLIVSKLMRGTNVDFDDCIMLADAHRSMLDISKLIDHFYEMISYDISEERIKPNIQYFTERLKGIGINV